MDRIRHHHSGIGRTALHEDIPSTKSPLGRYFDDISLCEFLRLDAAL